MNEGENRTTATATVTPLTPHRADKDWIETARDLATKFAARARHADEGDAFVAENYADLRAAGFFSAHVPAELGGGGADYVTLCAMVREIAKGCGATGLAFSMHSHQVAVAAWRWQNQKAPLEALLRRVATEQIVILSSGGSDWLESGGRAEKVEGGFKITARKGFASGAPAAALLMTSAVYDDPQAGPTVLHFGVPLKAEGVRLEETWRAMGMRGTGSHDIVLDGFFLADAAVGGKRPRGKWHMLFHIISKLAFPLIYSAYTGVAEGARDAAMAAAKGQKEFRRSLRARGRGRERDDRHAPRARAHAGAGVQHDSGAGAGDDQQHLHRAPAHRRKRDPHGRGGAGAGRWAGLSPRPADRADVPRRARGAIPSVARKCAAEDGGRQALGRDMDE